MNYEQKYKEALERAKKWHNAPNANKMPTYANRVIEEIFPEFKENKDERIRKAVLIYLDWLDGRKDYAPRGEYSIKDMIAWLKKQESVGEIVERCKTSWYNEGKIAGMAEGLTDDEKYQQGWHDALEKQGFCSPFDYEHATIVEKDFSLKKGGKK